MSWMEMLDALVAEGTHEVVLTRRELRGLRDELDRVMRFDRGYGDTVSTPSDLGNASGRWGTSLNIFVVELLQDAVPALTGALLTMEGAQGSARACKSCGSGQCWLGAASGGESASARVLRCLRRNPERTRLNDDADVSALVRTATSVFFRSEWPLQQLLQFPPTVLAYQAQHPED